MAISTLSDGRLEFVVHGLAFRQNPKSPQLFAFVASSNELLQFCGVARKSQDLLSNYQRALDETRVVEQVTPFFRDAQNCSPTAIVLSLQETNVCEIEFADAGVPTLDKGIDLKTLTLRLNDLTAASDEEIVELAKEFLDGRISASDGNSPDDTDDEEDAGEEEDEPEDSEEEEEEQPVEIGQSMLRTLRGKLDDPESLSSETLSALLEMLRPALVIDGQHRLFGAAGVEEDMPILVCTMVRPDWKEQVFQFIVVNDKAAGIPKPFITSLAGMSLTGTELDELRDRLSQAGMKLWEVEVMQRLGYDSDSPFWNIIEFKVAGGNVAGLGYQTMKRVGNAWYSPKSAGIYNLMNSIYIKPGDKKSTRKALRERWQLSSDWFSFFCLFWSAIKKKFETTPTWQVHSNLLTAVVIEMLQADFMKVLDAQGALLWKTTVLDDQLRRDEMTQRIRDLVDEFVEHFSVKHFNREWKRKSLNHKDGKTDLADLFRRIREGESITNHVIFTG